MSKEIDGATANVRRHLYGIENKLQKIQFESFKKDFLISDKNDEIDDALANIRYHLRGLEEELKRIENNI